METSRAQWFNQSWLYIKRILIVNATFLVVGFFWRLAFLFYYGKSAELATLKGDVLHAFILGTRFDSTVLFYVNAIPLLLLLLLSALSFRGGPRFVLDKVFKNFALFLVPYYTLMLFIVNYISAVDFGYYSFYQDRINVLIFGFFTDDTIALIKTIWRNYPMAWISLALFLFVYLLWKGLKINFTQGKEWLPGRVQKISYPVFVLFFFVIFVVNGVGARGSLALFPLSEMDTGISKSIFVNHLGFNGVRAFARAMELKALQTSKWDSNLKHFGYEENFAQAFADFYQIPVTDVPADPIELLKQKSPRNEWAAKNKPHVIILTMESLGSY
ncbi:MAG: LTA synthase family protein, partial [Bdellovibrio sp.]|nr:LTA synthase family protein [Bdellovibrio sp.]